MLLVNRPTWGALCSRKVILPQRTQRTQRGKNRQVLCVLCDLCGKNLIFVNGIIIQRDEKQVVVQIEYGTINYPLLEIKTPDLQVPRQAEKALAVQIHPLPRFKYFPCGMTISSEKWSFVFSSAEK
ncbi:MAG: hypothetical protein HY360_03010 [Verrucomicrobia bacterium]|nr:hypothetical protein [Verrucomicrobiota bacterium]